MSKKVYCEDCKFYSDDSVIYSVDSKEDHIVCDRVFYKGVNRTNSALFYSKLAVEEEDRLCSNLNKNNDCRYYSKRMLFRLLDIIFAPIFLPRKFIKLFKRKRS